MDFHSGGLGRSKKPSTEHGSLSKYADLFDFDVDEPHSYTSDYLLLQLTFAEENGYDVFLVDSLSHFWMGKDGALEYVDSVNKRTRDQMTGWKAFAPHERGMVDRFIASPCHIIVTMRVKTDYEEVIDANGKKKRVKVGLAPVQRQGLEYEFDLTLSMDDENNLMVGKTRCPSYSQERNRTASRPTAAYFKPFIDWLAGPSAIRASRPARVAIEPTINTGGHTTGTQAAADFVAQQKIQAGNPACAKPWTTRGEMKAVFEVLCDRVGQFVYHTSECGQYVDAGWSGAKARRPELDRLMADARARKVDIVLCWKLDRWGRSVSNSMATIQELVALGVRWIAMTQNLDTDESNPMARFLLHIMAAFAELEREMIRERVLSGMAAAKHGGKIFGRPKAIFDRDAVIKLHREGLSNRTVSKLLKIGLGTVQRTLKSRSPVIHGELNPVAP